MGLAWLEAEQAQRETNAAGASAAEEAAVCSDESAVCGLCQRWQLPGIRHRYKEGWGCVRERETEAAWEEAVTRGALGQPWFPTPLKTQKTPVQEPLSAEAGQLRLTPRVPSLSCPAPSPDPRLQVGSTLSFSFSLR